VGVTTKYTKYTKRGSHDERAEVTGGVRVPDVAAAMALERRLDPAQVLVRHQERVARALCAVLDRALKIPGVG